MSHTLRKMWPCVYHLGKKMLSKRVKKLLNLQLHFQNFSILSEVEELMNIFLRNLKRAQNRLTFSYVFKLSSKLTVNIHIKLPLYPMWKEGRKNVICTTCIKSEILNGQNSFIANFVKFLQLKRKMCLCDAFILG